MEGWRQKNRPECLEKRFEFASYEKTRDFLDVLGGFCEKVNRFPITFIVKTDLSENQVKESLYKSAQNKWVKESLAQKYIDLIEEVINRPTLLAHAKIISKDIKKMELVIKEIILQFQLEYGLLD